MRLEMSLNKTTWHDTEIGKVKIEAFDDNYLSTTTEIYWNDRIFRLDRYMTSLFIEEYEGKPLDSNVINTWEMPFPADPMTGEEVWKWFFFLVVSKDPERLAICEKQRMENFARARGQNA
jgi:hypothetical protein